MGILLLVSLVLSSAAIVISFSKSSDYLTREDFEAIMKNLGVEVYFGIKEGHILDLPDNRGNIHNFIEQKIKLNNYKSKKQLHKLAAKLGYKMAKNSEDWVKITH